MPKLLVAGKLHPAGVDRIFELEQEGYSVTYIEEITEESYAHLISDADALIIRTQPLSTETLDNASKLKVVSRHGVGYDAIDLNALNARNIALTIVGDVNSVSVAEHAMMMLLACAKHAIRGDLSVRDPSKWNWRNQLRPRVDLFPSGSEAALEESIDFVYDRINNGVYRCGFAPSQGAYDRALEELFAALDATEERLAGRRFLLGPHLTAADLCLLPTALRFEAVYAVLFRCCARPLGAYPNLLRWRRECWGVEGVASTFDLPAAMRSYYGQLFPLNPSGIVPPRPTLEELGLPPEPPELSRPEDVAALRELGGGEAERLE